MKQIFYLHFIGYIWLSGNYMNVTIFTLNIKLKFVSINQTKILCNDENKNSAGNRQFHVIIALKKVT